MKTWIVALAMMAGVAMNAQHGDRKHEGKKHGKEQMERFTPEQRAELQTKKLTLELDLTEKQQKEIKTYFTERGKERQKMAAELKATREAGKKISADQRFALQNKMLDDKIAAKAFFKKTLNPEQQVKFEALKNDRKEKITKKHENLKKRWGR